MIEAYTDMYLPVLGDGQDGKIDGLPPMRKITITKTTNDVKGIYGVIDGVKVSVRLDRVYKDTNRTRIQKKWIIDKLKQITP